MQAKKEQYGSSIPGSPMHQHHSLSDSIPVTMPLPDSASLTEQQAMHEQQVVSQHQETAFLRHPHQQQGTCQQQGDRHQHLNSVQCPQGASGSFQYAAPFTSSYNDNISNTTAIPASRAEHVHATQQVSDRFSGPDSEYTDHSHMQADCFRNCAHYTEQGIQVDTLPATLDNAAGLQGTASAYTHHLHQPLHHLRPLQALPCAWPSAHPQVGLNGSSTTFHQRPNLPQRAALSAAPTSSDSAAVAHANSCLLPDTFRVLHQPETSHCQLNISCQARLPLVFLIADTCNPPVSGLQNAKPQFP